MEFSVETLKEIQAYAYFFFTALLCVILYAYIYYLYSSEKRGEHNFEKFSNIALDDEVDSTPIKKNSNDEQKQIMEQNNELVK